MLEKLIFIGIYLLGVLISSASQILLKKSADKKYSSKIKEYLNLNVIISYTIFFIATLITIFAFKKCLPPWDRFSVRQATFLWRSSAGFSSRKKSRKMKMLGLGIIVAGILIYRAIKQSFINKPVPFGAGFLRETP